MVQVAEGRVKEEFLGNDFAKGLRSHCVLQYDQLQKSPQGASCVEDIPLTQ